MSETQTWTIEHSTLGGTADDVLLAVVMPTYRRPEHVILSAASIAAQQPGIPFALIVVENEASERAGANAIGAMMTQVPLPCLVVVEPNQGNCNAYNAGFAAAFAHFPALAYIAIIDDDEIAAPEWLAELVRPALDGEADIVGGPQRPVFEDPKGERLYSHHPVFQPAHHASGSAGIITSTGNCLIRADALRAMAPDWLDPAFNFLGGGDTDFFTRCAARGYRFHWAENAVVHETVPSRRTSREWITARSLRNGLISAIIHRRQRPGLVGRLTVIGKSLALLAVSPIRALMLWQKTGSAYVGSYHIMIGVGRLLSEFGYRIEQYRNPEKN